MAQPSRRLRHDDDAGSRPGDDDPDASPESVARRIALTALTTAPRTRAELAGIKKIIEEKDESNYSFVSFDCLLGILRSNVWDN